jgi:hypothetical protein
MSPSFPITFKFAFTEQTFRFPVCPHWTIAFFIQQIQKRVSLVTIELVEAGTNERENGSAILPTHHETLFSLFGPRLRNTSFYIRPTTHMPMPTTVIMVS